MKEIMLSSTGIMIAAATMAIITIKIWLYRWLKHKINGAQ